LKLETGSK
jgi:phage shock protein A